MNTMITNLDYGYKPSLISTIVDVRVPGIEPYGYKPSLISTIVD